MVERRARRVEEEEEDDNTLSLAQMEETVRAEMRRQTPRIEIGDISTSGGRLSFFVRDIAQLDAAVERIRTLSQPVGMKCA